MKKLVVIAIALCTLTSFAQEKRKKWNEVSKEMKRSEGKVSPEDRAKLETKQMTLKLDLSAQQQEQVQSTLLAHYQDGKAKMNTYKKSKTKRTEEQRKQARLDRLDSQIALKQKMKEILNTEQYQRFEKTMAKRMRGKSAGKRKRGRK